MRFYKDGVQYLDQEGSIFVRTDFRDMAFGRLFLDDLLTEHYEKIAILAQILPRGVTINR